MKFGIVAEGGASRGLFTSGVLDALLKEDIMCDYYCGVSAGIAFGVSYLSRQIGRNLEVALKYMNTSEYMGLRNLFKGKNYYNIPFVFDKIPNKLCPFDYKKFKEYEGEVEAVVTNIHTGRAEYLHPSRTDRVCREVVASCAMPVFFEPVRIGRRYYLDGGVSDPIPYRHALEKKKCDKTLVILTRPRGYIKTNELGEFVSKRLYSKYPYIVEDIDDRACKYNYDLKTIKQLEEEGRIFVIAPSSIYGARRTEKDPTILKQLYKEGLGQMQSKMADFKEYLKD